MKKILFPVEDLNIPEKALSMAIEFARSFSAEVLVLHVQPFTETAVYPYAHLADPWDEEAMNQISRRITDNALNQFAAAGIPAQARIVLGDPAGEILECAVDERCDLILMSTHGMGTVKRFLLGSVANRVVHHAKTPVLVVR